MKILSHPSISVRLLPLNKSLVEENGAVGSQDFKEFRLEKPLNLGKLERYDLAPTAPKNLLSVWVKCFSS
jgi:hypothetical protein